MTKQLIFGHKSPDTDTICSAIVYADLKKQLGYEVEPVRLGELNGETSYALDYFNQEAPRFVETVANETGEVILVDHNERQQSVDDIDEVEVKEVIDHHRIANFETKSPLYYRAEPVGCTATILNKMYKENGVEVSETMAGLMVSSIISDSLLFKSPTCTAEDEKAAEELAAKARIDLNEYGLDMLKAGTDISGKSAEELISLDAKAFDMGEANVRIAQVNTVDTNEVLSRKEELEGAMQKEIDDNGYDLFVLLITDILDSDSTALTVGDKQEAVEKAFDVKLEDNKAVLKDVVSRKKQVVPPLNKVLG
ncbi:manganese-dependent inorganic pyrophosphatase [Salimicrobium halophilum]|uniref:Probable manganese-dependent inorganic pyrophosphatase n=1 Tax=Salimicrobium halophilum TaxID=86666 RepID=A0A1G8RNS1_9BACI|nr:manganese-dependent inorganic pyrophosphatase [Salimicrobium halophilum]SDJ18040.1 manganese-dependent inorganic pyrophosphatase [Salimicrobium halophilum]